jgi:ABC-type transport system involved in multi-copper enzyme maturation permease subunit
MPTIIAGLFGPVFVKEMLEMARRKRYYASRVLYGLALLFVLFMAWEANSYRMRNGLNVREVSHVAESFAAAINGVQFGAVFLFVPLFLGGVIAGEREERTLEQLFTTQLSNSQIVIGKLASRVVGLIGLLICGLPVLSFVSLFGGVDPGTMLRCWSATILAILYASAHTIYFTTITKTPLGALVRTYWWMAVWIIGVPFATGMILEGFFRGINPRTEHIILGGLMAVNPIAPFVLALDGFSYVRVAAIAGPWAYPALFVLPSLWSLFLIWRAVRRLRGNPIPFRWIRVPLVGRFWRFTKRSLSAATSIVPRPRMPSAGALSRFRLPVRNPLWLRSRQARVYDREGYMGRIQTAGWFAAAFFFILIVIASRRELHHSEFSIGFLVPTWIALMFTTTLVAGSSLVGDRRRGFLELVLITPLTPREIIDGTALSIWEHIKRVYWLAWVLGAVFCLTGASLPYGVLFSLLSGTLFLTLITFHGVACSLAARTLVGALITTVLLPVVTIIGTLMIMGLFYDDHGPFLWILCGVALPVTWFWVKRRPNAASVGLFSVAAHLSLAALVSCWTIDSRAKEYPIAAMHPGYIVIVTLERNTNYWFDHHSKDWPPILVGYWLALAFNILWFRWWLIRNFDRIVGRIDPRAKQKPSAKQAEQRYAKAPAEAISPATPT